MEPVFTISTNDLTPLFAFLSLCISGFVSIALSWIAYKQAQLLKIMKMTHDSTNSKMDELLKVAIAAAEARGIILGRGEINK
jgi:hypothetical protein